MTPEERTYFQGLVDNMHTQFIRDVSAGRTISVSQLTPLATGQVWTGQQALPLHLIDKQGSFRDALLETAKQVGISGEPNVVKPPKKGHSVLDLITSDADDLWPNPSRLLEKHAGFYFLWR
jgi:protease-4